ncbi:nucleoside phosphorylase [Longibaculum muris]|mgnify:FL=1|uniref:nucleoside phosphorylase n=1 Tax=Longibaculum muris TaxID=1796628 RepID=UPI00189D2FE5|nr:nucleoside phosphorylase [Longibaculum muris]
MWFYKNDKTSPVLTSTEQAKSEHGEKIYVLPQTAILLYMSGLDYIKEKYDVQLITDRFPRFLNACPIYKIKGQNDICFLDGGRGAPMAADTIEVLKVMGVKNIISVGLIGGFVENINIGDIVIPNKAYVEEGTSLHYYETIEYSTPNLKLFNKIIEYIPKHIVAPIISTDAIYRQTFYKEALWRKKGCVGVDMETSALMSIGKYLDLQVVSILMVSDKHPISKENKTWEWKMTKDLRKQLLYQVIEFALSL